MGILGNQNWPSPAEENEKEKGKESCKEIIPHITLTTLMPT